MSARPQNEQPLAVLILAAGQGTRMKSARSKVLHEIAGKPMLGYPVELAEGLCPEHLVVVIGRDAEAVAETFRDRARFVVQEPQRGTGHAVETALPALADFEGEVLVLYGDTPLLRPESVAALRAKKAETGAPLVMLTSPAPLPGLVVRGPDGRVERIVEQTDASPEELLIQEGNTGVYLMELGFLRKALSELDDQNEQGELYLTGVVSRARAHGLPVEAVKMADADEALGVNTRAELARAAAVQRRRNVDHWMNEGVTFIDPDHVYLDTDVRIGRDSQIDPGVVVTGPSVIGERVHVKAHCVVETAELGDEVVIGPSAHLRPGTRLGRGCRIGNFVEVKNSELGDGAKADHLAYIGDAQVGAGSSFGCGAITVNYDWENKHPTTVGEGVRIGCNVNLVAPVELGDGSYVAAGSTITKDVPAGALAVAKASQRTVEGWGERRRQQKQAKPEPNQGTSGSAEGSE